MKPRNEKWLLPSIYKPPLQNNEYFVSSLTDLLVFCSYEYDNKVVLGDFNLDRSSPSMLTLMNSHNFVNLIKKTCFKGTGSCIYTILASRKYSFKNTFSYITGLIDHHHLIHSVIKRTFKCEESKKLVYRNYSNFSQKNFQSNLLLNIRDGKNNCLEFVKNFVEMLNKQATTKTKIIRANHNLNLKIKQIKRKTLMII